MKRPTIEEIHASMRRKGMKVFEKPFDATLGGIRTIDNSSNKFNDWGFMSMFTKDGGIMSIVAPITTDAGLFYRNSPISPDGTAIIKHDVQHRSCYTYMEKNGHKDQEAFRQTGPMDYWRDNDKDSQLEFDGKEFSQKIFNTNGHDMGTVGADVNKWSAGCWGSVQEVMDLFYGMAKIQIAHGNGDKFSYAMLYEKTF